MEIEAKYTIPSAEVFQLLLQRDALGDFRLRESAGEMLHDTYLDTADLAIWQAGYALRRRKKGNTFVMTLKALAGGEGAIKRREELEVVIPKPDLPAHWPPGAVRDRVIEYIGGASILPLFELEQMRHERLLTIGDRPVCMVSLDAVTLTGKERNIQFFVLEAELLPEGTEEELKAVMRALHDTWGLEPATETKLQRALAYFHLAMPDLPGERLTPAERLQLDHIAKQPTMYGRRAQALLLLDSGATQIEAAQRARMSERRVRYWLAEWRQQRIGIFPEKVRATVPTDTEPVPKPPTQAVPNGMPSPITETPQAAEPDLVDAPKTHAESASPVLPTAEGQAADPTHLQAVMELAGQLFDLLQPWHGLAEQDAVLLREIALQHDVGMSVDPERHDVAGYELLHAKPPAHLGIEEARLAALAILLHSQRLRPKVLQALLDRAGFDTLGREQQHRALVLSALLRMADGLDFRHTGSTRIMALEERERAHHEIIITVAGPFAGSDAERANEKADLWARIFSPHISFQTPRMSSTELLGHLLQLPENVATPEAIALPATPGLNLNDTMAEAARKTFLFHFQRMLFLEPTTRLGENIEALHDMRVAARRMRTAAQVFAAYLDNAELRPFLKGLRQTGDTLGAVRDLDVFWEKTELFLSSIEESTRPDLAPLHAVWQLASQRAREQMIAYLDSNAYRRFRERFAAHLEMPWKPITPPFNAKGEALPQSVRHCAPMLIVERVAAVRAFDSWMRVPDAPLSRYHRLRIAGKRLRYTLEYFAEVLGPEAKALINQVKLLQDHLGDLQDAVVASNLLRDFLIWGTWGHPADTAMPPEPIIAPGVAAYLTARQLELQQRRDTFLTLWEQFCSPEFSKLVANTIASV